MIHNYQCILWFSHRLPIDFPGFSHWDFPYHEDKKTQVVADAADAIESMQVPLF